ncbi:MAG: N-acetylmuramoyl-L-alanine amidase [Clostridia bacterium]|nr:N-acetylmuramoyl-L-alanine amidase [Clostridia bacterium]
MSRGLIVLDPGHGQFGNPHTTREGYYEGTQNFILANALKAELERCGFEVMTTRPQIEDNPDLEERGKLAGVNHAILFLSLHSNAPGSATPPEQYKAVRGAVTYYSISDPVRNADLATRLNDAVSACMETTNRGIKTRTYPDRPDLDYYGVLRHSVGYGCSCAMLIEHGFHTNPEDSAFLQSTDCLKRLARAEADVLDSFFD